MKFCYLIKLKEKDVGHWFQCCVMSRHFVLISKYSPSVFRPPILHLRGDQTLNHTFARAHRRLWLVSVFTQSWNEVKQVPFYISFLSLATEKGKKQAIMYSTGHTASVKTCTNRLRHCVAHSPPGRHTFWATKDPNDPASKLAGTPWELKQASCTVTCPKTNLSWIHLLGMWWR